MANPDVNDNTNSPDVRFRAVPFGPPQSKNNEINNPGRQQYIANRAYVVTRVSDALNLYWMDEHKKIGSGTEWQSGPSNANVMGDQASKHAGFWTSPGGNNCDWENGKGAGAGSPEKETSLSVTGFLDTYDGNDEPIIPFNLGITKWGETGENEGMEYGVCGMSGYIRPSHNEQVKDSKNEAEIGIRHLYLSYRPDSSTEELNDIIGGGQTMSAGVNVVWDAAKILFPDYASGNISYSVTEKGLTGFTSNFPEDFDAQTYFVENRIGNDAIQEFFAKSRILDVLRGITMKDSMGVRSLLALITEKMNVLNNEKRGVKGAHNFTNRP